MKVNKTVFRVVSLLALATALAACSSNKKSKLAYDDEGRERISILTSTQSLEVDRSISQLQVVLPLPYENDKWTQSGGNAEHLVEHVALGDTISQVWQANIGQGNEKYERLVSGPVAANGKVFAVDVKGRVTAVSIDTGKQLWSTELKGEERSKVAYGGGVAYDDGKLYVSSGYGFVAALNASNGAELWRYKGEVPFRGAPTASKDKIFAVTQDNQMLALDSATGEMLWDQVGIAETAGMLGAASPAYDGETMIAALSSGELIAMRGANGRILWQDSLSSSLRLTPLASLTDIDGNPVINDGKAYAVSHSGRMVSIDMRSGERSWEADVAGVNTPVIAGGFIFVTTVDGQVACLTKSDGRVRWVSQLQRFTNQEKRRGLIKWNGPVLGGDRLLVTSSHGYVASVSPYTGDVISVDDFSDGSTTAPIIVDKTFIILTDKGDLVAYR